jgi:hypothetical protein
MTEYVVQGLATEELQEELRDLLGLAVVGDQVRWVVVGDEAGGSPTGWPRPFRSGAPWPTGCRRTW